MIIKGEMTCGNFLYRRLTVFYKVLELRHLTRRPGPPGLDNFKRNPGTGVSVVFSDAIIYRQACMVRGVSRRKNNS